MFYTKRDYFYFNAKKDLLLANTYRSQRNPMIVYKIVSTNNKGLIHRKFQYCLGENLSCGMDFKPICRYIHVGFGVFPTLRYALEGKEFYCGYNRMNQFKIIKCFINPLDIQGVKQFTRRRWRRITPENYEEDGDVDSIELFVRTIIIKSFKPIKEDLTCTENLKR